MRCVVVFTEDILAFKRLLCLVALLIGVKFSFKLKANISIYSAKRNWLNDDN